MQAIRWRQYKGVRPRPGASLEVYDLDKDPAELTDLAARLPEITRQLESLLAANIAPVPGAR